MSSTVDCALPGETLDHLVGSWRQFQLARGHRCSTDDLLTAWTAARARPEARLALDLGSGIGSVGLSLLHQLGPDARLVTVEVQELSIGLARRTVAWNGLADRVTLRLGDLRDEHVVPEDCRYALVTGSPPYIPLGSGAVSPHPQKAGARMELKGDVFDYCAAAARSLAPEGAFCFCHSARDPRPEAAIEAAGLRLLARQDVCFRAGAEPMIALFTCAWGGDRDDLPPLVIRDQDGAWTEEYRLVRRQLGREVPNAAECGAEPRRS